MSRARTVLAFDLGAGSGRAVIGQLTQGEEDGAVMPRLSICEVHRFPNEPVQAGGRLHWDILRLLHEIKQGIRKAQLLHGAGTAGLTAEEAGMAPSRTGIASIGIDSWAVDFGLLGANGELLGNPYHYRDRHTDGMIEELCERLGKERLFGESGIQFLPFNTIYQLYALKKADSPLLKQAETLLMIPDLLIYFLTGEKICEFTNASTTQMLHPLTRDWNEGTLAQLGLPAGLLLPAEQPGTVIGKLSPEVCEELDVPAIPVTAVGEHDTASAVAAVPAGAEPFAYLICGTWSLLGTEVSEPALGPQALAWNFTNEGGVGGTYRLLRNIMGLWLLQESKRHWDNAGSSRSYEELVQSAEQAEPFRCLINPDDDIFLPPGDMPERIREFCRRTGQYVPQSEGEIVRCILESLALTYRLVLERTERLAGASYARLHMVGGGINNRMLCQFTASAIGRAVWAGPVEASAIGNVLVQLMALGHIESLEDGRAIVRESFPIDVYEPSDTAEWRQAYASFQKLLQ
ncbi:rhamnulokinase [Paenibacillus sp. MBLB4367]|uniref:rhamnulokinase n=1 Tax=Paenibacillus sp. MBLB4367 TaxID=3384767 RepID=UPI003907F9A0